MEPKQSKLAKQGLAGTTVRLPWSAGAVCDVKTYLPVGGLPLCVVANAVKQTRQLVLENSRLDGFVPRHDAKRAWGQSPVGATRTQAGDVSPCAQMSLTEWNRKKINDRFVTDLFLNPLEPKPSKLAKQGLAGTTVRLLWSAGAVCDVKTYLPVGGLPLCVFANAVKQSRHKVSENSRLDGFVPRHDAKRAWGLPEVDA